MFDRAKRLRDEDWRRLAALLGAEDGHYRRLLRLAWRQNSYMKRQDVDRLEANAEEWSRYLPGADAARIARERCCDDLHRTGGIPGAGVATLMEHCSPDGRDALAAALDRVRRSAARLARQNELNRHLADFCIGLAEEESRIFRDCVLDDPAGCYGRDARNTARGAGGVLARQA